MSTTFLNFFKKIFFGCFVAAAPGMAGTWFCGCYIYKVLRAFACMVGTMFCGVLPGVVGFVWMVSNIYCTRYNIYGCRVCWGRLLGLFVGVVCVSCTVYNITISKVYITLCIYYS